MFSVHFAAELMERNTTYEQMKMKMYRETRIFSKYWQQVRPPGHSKDGDQQDDEEEGTVDKEEEEQQRENWLAEKKLFLLPSTV